MNKEPEVVALTKELCQEEDTSGRPNEEHQFLKIETVSNGCASYIAIETERWAITDKEEWYALWNKQIEPILKEVNKDITVVATPTLCVDLD